MIPQEGNVHVILPENEISKTVYKCSGYFLLDLTVLVLHAPMTSPEYTKLCLVCRVNRYTDCRAVGTLTIIFVIVVDVSTVTMFNPMGFQPL